MIKKYRLKDSTVSAVYYDGSNYDEVAAFCDGMAYKPYYKERGVRLFTLNTKFGETKVSPGMYIIKLKTKLFIATPKKEFHKRYEEDK